MWWQTVLMLSAILPAPLLMGYAAWKDSAPLTGLPTDMAGPLGDDDVVEREQ